MSADILVAGSAHLDILGTSTGDDATIDKVGEVSIEIGGAGGNIATNLAHLGLRPRLLTGMAANSTYSEIIKAHLRSNGVEVRVLQCDGLPDAIFSAHIKKDGDLLSAISSMPLDRVRFEDHYVAQAMIDVRCVVIESNLSAESMQQIARIARGLAIPIYATTAAEEKCLRLGGLSGLVDGVFMNEIEADYFDRHAAVVGQSGLMAGRFGCPVVVSRGEMGALIIHQGRMENLPLGTAPKKGKTLGAGDALLAASIVHHVFNGVPFADAVRQSFPFADRLIGRSNCNIAPPNTVAEALHVLGGQARTDALTGLANRRAAEQALERASDGNQGFSVLMIDIDHFKRINDAHGHAVGDAVLQEVSKLLQSAVRGSDLACRWGGEEFLCVLPGIGQAAALVIAERIRSDVEMAAFAKVGGVTVSIGAGSFSDGVNVKGVVRQADESLYLAKRSGRNRVEPSPRASSFSLVAP